MVDIGRDFGDSFNFLMRNKKLIVPIFFSILIPLILVSMFIYLSGLNPLMKELGAYNREFEQQKAAYLANPENIGEQGYAGNLLNYLGKDNARSTYNDEYAAFLAEKEFDWSRFADLINPKNIILFILFVLLIVLSSFYLSCMSYAIIVMALRKKKASAAHATNWFLWKFLSLKILKLLIVFGPIALAALVIIPLFTFNKFLGVITIIIAFLAMMAYLVLVGLRLFFIEPALFAEGRPALETVRESWGLTKGYLKKVLLIFFVITGISLFINSFVGQPLYGAYSNFLFEPSWLRSAVNFLLVAVFLVLEAFVFTFQRIFLFHTYLDFKGWRAKK